MKVEVVFCKTSICPKCYLFHRKNGQLNPTMFFFVYLVLTIIYFSAFVIKLNSLLLIDDDVINNFINSRLIRKIDMSHNLHVSTNGKEAILYLNGKLGMQEAGPELILLDINMPVMDGFEFVEAFRKLNFSNQEKIVIVMLTTSSNPKDLEKVDALSIGGYINKPLTEEKLKNVLARNFPK